MLELLSEARRAAAACAAAPAWAVPDCELPACLTQAWAAMQQLTATVAHLIHQAKTRDLPKAHGASSTPVWLRAHVRARPGAAKQLVELGEALDTRPALDDAMSSGTISDEQALTVAAMLHDLPATLGPDLIDEAEWALLDLARKFDPIGLERLSDRVLAMVAPEVADERDKAFLDRQEKAYSKRGFTMSPIGEGRVRLSGYLDALGAATINAALDPLCHPRRDDPATPRTPAQRRADALVDICAAALRGDADLPRQGGDAAQVVVTVPFTALTNQLGRSPKSTRSRRLHQGAKAYAGANADPDAGAGADPDAGAGADPDAGAGAGAGAGLGANTAPDAGAVADTSAVASARAVADAGAVTGADADMSAGAGLSGGWLDTGAPISAAEARMLACDARILPAVLGGDSQVLDLGRSRRLFSGPVRRALILRDRGCTFPSCDRPARWSEGHHIRSWPDNGLTEPANGCLVCRFHHRLLHDNSGWQVRMAADGHPEYLPPATVDPQRRPRRNPYHRRQ